MIDELATQLAFRNRALTLSVCTTGSTTLTATTSGYTRASGSFVTDGFKVGMEVSGTGFNATNNAPSLIVGVAASTLTIDRATANTVQTAAAARTLSVGLPALRSWENKKFTPTAKRLYIAEQFTPSTHKMVTFPASQGLAVETGLYVLTLYGVDDTGVAGIRKTIGALKALFAPGTTITSSVYVRTDIGPTAGQIIPLDNGFATCQLTIYWQGDSRNVIAA